MSRKKLVFTAIILALVLAIGGILAYFTDVQTKTNKFTMGKVEIEVDEGEFPEDGVTDVMPGAEFDKSPKVINKGTTPVYAFVEVTIPYDTVKVGNAEEAAEKELFELLHITGEDGTTEIGINSGWVSVNFDGSSETATDSGVYAKKTPNGEGSTMGTVTFVYAYADEDGKLTALAGKTGDAETGDETNTLFDKVRFIDVTETDPENSNIQGETFNVVVSGYGIQTTELGLDDDTATNPAEVWKLVKK